MRGLTPDLDLQRPLDFPEALQRLAQGWRPFAGGTDLMVLHAAGRLPSGGYLDLTQLPELMGIRETDRLIDLGALVTYTELLAHPGIHRCLPLLVKSARATGALAIQNRGTLGGNLANGSPAADTPPSLLAYGAELLITSVRGTRVVPYEAFHTGYKAMDLASDELIARIRVPKPEGLTVHYFRKVGARKAQAIAKLSLALCAEVREESVVEIRIGLGAVAPVPVRARHAEVALRGSPVRALPVDLALEALKADMCPIDDLRSTAHYRATVTGNLLRQALASLATAQEG